MSNVLLNKQKNEEINVKQSKVVEEQKLSNLQDQLQETGSKMLEQGSISSAFQEKTMADNVDELEGPVPGEPKYIGLDKKFATVKQDDSSNMIRIREAVKAYNDASGDEATRAALNNIIKACNSYTRFKFFKRGRALERLEEVKELRERAVSRLDSFTEQKNKMIHNDASEEESVNFINRTKNTGTMRHVTALAGALLGVTFGNLFKLATFQPLWRKNINWKPSGYYRGTVDFMDRTFGQVKFVEQLDESGNVIGIQKTKIKISNTSHKDKLKSKTLEAEERMIKQDLEDLETLEQGGEIIDEEEYFDEQVMKDKTEFQEAVKEKALENLQVDQNYSDLQLKEKDAEYNEEELKEKIAEFEAFDLKTINFRSNAEMLNGFETSMRKLAEIRSVQNLFMRGLMRGFKLDDKKLIKLRAKFNCAFEMQQYLARLNKMASAGKIDFSKSDEEIREQVGEQIKLESKKSLPRMIANPADLDGFLADYEKMLQKEYKGRKASIKRVYNITEHGSADGDMPDDLLKKKMDAYETNAMIYDYVHQRTQIHSAISSWGGVLAYRQQQGLKEINSPSRSHGNFLHGKSPEECLRLTRLIVGPEEEEAEKLKAEIMENDTKEITDEKQKSEYVNAQYEAILAKDRIQYYRECIRDMKSIDYKEFNAQDLSKLYDNYERKMIVLSLFTNSRSFAQGIRDSLAIIRKAEIAKIRKTNPDYKEDPKERLELPQELKDEFGYGNLDDLMKDMHVAMEFGNAVQSKFDAIAQLGHNEFLPYYSMEEITSVNTETQEKVAQNINTYAKEILEEDNLSDPVEIDTDQHADFDWAEDLRSHLEYINIGIKTRKISMKDKEKGKHQDALTHDVDVMQILKEEEQAYWKESIDYGRKVKDGQLAEESKNAQEYVKRTNEMIHSRDDQVNAKIPKKETRHRFIAGYVGPMATLLGDTKEKTDERIDALNINVAKATTEQKQRMAKELESAFKIIINFDLKELNFNDFGDIVKGDYDKVVAMTSLCFEFNELFKDYAKLMDDPSAGTLLTKEEYAELKTKKDYLQSLNVLYTVLPQNMANEALHKKHDAVKIMGLSEADLYDKIEKEKEAGNKEMEIALNEAAIPGIQLEEVGGVTCGMDMKEKYRRMRVDRGAPKDDPTESIKEKLKDR